MELDEFDKTDIEHAHMLDCFEVCFRKRRWNTNGERKLRLRLQNLEDWGQRVSGPDPGARTVVVTEGHFERTALADVHGQ